MKYIKVILILIALVVITTGVYSFFKLRVKERAPKWNVPNVFVDETKKKIENLNNEPDSLFSVAAYQNIKNDIDVYAQAGKLDSNMKIYLLQILDYTYTPVFGRQAYKVFRGYSWEPHRIDTIRTEVNYLVSSDYIEDKAGLKKIQSVVSKYDEINTFLINAMNFASDIGVYRIDQKFDLPETKRYISKAAGYKKDKSLVRNCRSIQTRLGNVSMNMYNKHLGYLKSKVVYSTGKYKKYKNDDEYYKIIYRPVYTELKNFLDGFSIYPVSYKKADNDLSRLRMLLDSDQKAAELYFNKKQ